MKSSTTLSKSLTLAGTGLALAAATFAAYSGWRDVAPFGIEMPDLAGRQAVDPRTPITVEAVGLGAQLTEAELRDASGKVLPGKLDPTHYTLTAPLEFGVHYTLKVTVERSWLGQSETQEISFATPDIPKLDGPEQRALAPDSSLEFSFDRPVGKLEASGEMQFVVEPSIDKRSFRLVASHYGQDKAYPVELKLWTEAGIPLPSARLEVRTPPALTAEVSHNGQTNLGLAIPLQVTFSEPLADKDALGKRAAVQTKDGKPVEGKWQWINKRRVQFIPKNNWPAASTIEARIDPEGPRSLRGGFLEQPLTASFSTGSDRKIIVYLDRQRADAMENGQVVKSFAVSTGKPKTPTVTGNFYIYARFPVKTMRSRAKPGEKGHYVVEDVPYAQYFHEDYAFHGAWWHNGFGHPASHGCVNMSTRKHNKRWPGVPEDAGWLYQWASIGVPVSVLPRSQTQVAANEAAAASAPKPSQRAE